MTDKTLSTKDILAAAQSAMKDKRYDVAADLFAQILIKMPNHGKARAQMRRVIRETNGHYALSQASVDQIVVLLNRGEFAEVITQTRILIVNAPKEPLLYNIMGMAQTSIGADREAEKYFTTATKLNPNYAEAYANLGGVLLQLTSHKEAIEALKVAVRLKPNLAEAWHNLAIATEQSGDLDNALIFVDKALSKNTSYVNALNTKSSLLIQLFDNDGAIACLKRALDIEPNNTELLTNLGYAYSGNEQEIQAIENLEKVTQLEPENAEVWYRMGILHTQIGKRDDGLRMIHRALALDPDRYDIYQTLSLHKTYTENDPDFLELVARQKRDDLRPGQRIPLSFALGKAYEDIGRHKEAFEHWKIGNATRYATLNYTIDVEKERFARIREVFSAEYINSYDGPSDDTQKPIFVLGMMRSGTTLVEQILAAHSQVSGAGELVEINNFGSGYLSGIDENNPIEPRLLMSKYTQKLNDLGAGLPYVVDKMPINFIWIGLIKTIFPNAKIISMLRNPMDNCLSIYKNNFAASGNEYAYDLEDLAEFTILHRDLMQYWDHVFGDAIFQQSYEAITNDLEGESRRLLEYCKLPYESSVLEFHKSKNVVKSASISQVRNKISTASVNSWEKYSTELSPAFEILKKAGLVSDS